MNTKENEISFKSKGQKIYGILHLPNKRTKCAVIFSNGYMDNIYSSHIIINAAREFSKSGYAFLRFNGRGRWPSGGVFTKIGIRDEVSDLESAINFIRTKGFKKIGLIGHSLGGVDVILSNKKNVSSVALWEPSYIKVLPKLGLVNKKMIRDLKVRGYGVHEKFGFLIGKKMWRDWTDPKLSRGVSNKISRLQCPMIVVAGTKELVKPAKEYFSLAKGPKSIKLIKNASHTFDRLDQEKEVIKSTLNWFDRWLK